MSGDRKLWTAAALCFSLALSSPAAAQKLQGELGVFAGDAAGDAPSGLGPGDGSAFTLSPLFEAELPLAGSLGMAAEWGLVYTSLSPDMGDSESNFKPGNPYLGATYTLIDTVVSAELGLGAALPLANLADDDPGAAATAASGYLHALGMRGSWNAWLWMRETLSFVVPFHVALSDIPLVDLSGDAAVAVFVPTEDTDARDVDVGTQLGAEASLGLGLLSPGLRLQLVWNPTADGDNAQTSIEPFLQTDLGPLYARLSFLYNLDEPFGPSFDEGRVWGLRLAAGGEL